MRKIILLAVLAICTFPLFAQQNPYPKTISVAGSAEMEVVPDEIYVVVELQEYDKKGSGKVNLDMIKSDFLGYCKQVGLADSVISIASYEGDNPYWWKKKKKKDDLYASISYQVKFSESNTMDKLVALLDDNATEKFEIVRTYHSRMVEYRRQLKIMAIKAAKEKAGYLAEAINEKAGEAISVNEANDYGYNNSWNYNVRANSMSSQAIYRDGSDENSQGVDFKKIKLRFEVTVTFALK